MASLAANLRLMKRAARAAEEGLIRDFGEVESLQASAAGAEDFVTRADSMAERIIIELLEDARPDYGFLMGEESSIIGNDEDKRWIINPLNGNLNFSRGVPHCAISIAYEERGRVVAGVIHDILRGEIFTASLGDGAYINDQRIRVTSRRHLAEALVATGIRGGQGKTYDEIITKELIALMPHVAGVRRFGAVALDMAWVACGRLDAFWERGVKPWDVAAGLIIAREAGALCSDYGDPKKPMGDAHILEKGRILAAASPLHRSLTKLLLAVQKTK